LVKLALQGPEGTWTREGKQMPRWHRLLTVILLAVGLGGGVAWAQDKVTPQPPKDSRYGYEEPVQEKMELQVDMDSKENPHGTRPEDPFQRRPKNRATRVEEVKKKRGAARTNPEAKTDTLGFLKAEPGGTLMKTPKTGLGSHPFINKLSTTLTEDREVPRKKPKEGPDTPKPRNRPSADERPWQ
jgi:hypothetical protein